MLLTEQEKLREFISTAVEKHDRQRSALLPILWAIQEGVASENGK